LLFLAGKFGVPFCIVDNEGKPGESRTATSSVVRECTKHSEAMA
jgi:hypothetical protein